jgi:hypothetical protein
MIEDARTYRTRGLSVIPCHRKHPLVEWEPYQQEPPHPDQVDEWWTRWPSANVGIVTGAVSGMVVLDADGPQGLDSLKMLRTPATTWLSRTGRPEGGLQQSFRHPGVTISNRAGVLPGLDVRGDRGFVVVPPSLHASGRRYEWLTPPDRMALAPLPENVLDLLTAPPAPAAPPTGDEISEGQRNDTLYRIARSLRARGLTPGAVHVAVAEENRARCRPPLPDREVRELVEHALVQPHRPAAANHATIETPSADLGLVPLGQLLAEPAEVHAYVVDNRLPAAGLGLLAGKPKAGKSTAARCLALDVARGRPWLGHATTPGVVIYLALEEKRAEVREHFQALGATAADPIFVLCASAPADALSLLRAEADRRHPVLVIIDPLFRFIHVDDGNDYATMTAALEPLLVLARETGAHVLLVHHLGKGERNDGGDNVLGSTAIFAAVDSALLMKRTEKYRTLSSIQRYGDDLDEITLTLDPDTRNVCAGPPRSEAEQADAEGLILKFLTGRQPVTETELDDVECRTKPKRAALRALVACGKVSKTGRGGKADPFRYALPGTTIAAERLL